jgi:hypothetical protein
VVTRRDRVGGLKINSSPRGLPSPTHTKPILDLSFLFVQATGQAEACTPALVKSALIIIPSLEDSSRAGLDSEVLEETGSQHETAGWRLSAGVYDVSIQQQRGGYQQSIRSVQSCIFGHRVPLLVRAASSFSIEDQNILDA